MANTLTAITDDAFKAAEIVGNEPAGILNAVMLNTSSEGAAQGASVKSVRTAETTINTSATPAMTIPEGDDQTFSELSMAMDQVASARYNITGEEQKQLNSNYDFETIHGSRLLRAFRGLRNQIASQSATLIYKFASRATGTAGTTPFASDFDVLADLRKIHEDNGFWMPGEMSVVMGTGAAANLRKLTNLQTANTAGGDTMLRRGDLLDLLGYELYSDKNLGIHTKGTGTSYDVDLVAGYSAGDTTIHVDTGTGTILAGDVVTFSGDTSYGYVVGTGFAGDGDGDIILNDPGLQAAVADNEDLVIGNNYTYNLGICRQAVEIAARPMAAPSNDAADEVIRVPDVISGLEFEIRIYGGYHKSLVSINVVYGARAWEPGGLAILMG